LVLREANSFSHLFIKSNLPRRIARITTANELAQSYFNQGLRLTYAFNHSEAQRAFRKAQKLDPDCAMCFWGEALVLGPNINLPMQEDAVAPAFAASSRRGIVGISG
jgi:hypothetical protein